MMIMTGRAGSRGGRPGHQSRGTKTMEKRKTNARGHKTTVLPRVPESVDKRRVLRFFLRDSRRLYIFLRRLALWKSRVCESISLFQIDTISIYFLQNIGDIDIKFIVSDVIGIVDSIR
jgi:hypothetical protein